MPIPPTRIVWYTVGMTQTQTHPTTAVCERCGGRINRTRRTTLAQAIAVHADTCPGKR